MSKPSYGYLGSYKTSGRGRRQMYYNKNWHNRADKLLREKQYRSEMARVKARRKMIIEILVVLFAISSLFFLPLICNPV